MNILIFQINGRELGLELVQVREVIGRREITPVPGAPDFIRGLILYRGKALPLISPGIRLGDQGRAAGELSRIIITRISGHPVGLVVDRVDDVEAIPPEEIVHPEEVIREARYLTGVARVREKLVLLIDIEKVLTEEEVISLEEVYRRVKVKVK